MSDVIKEEAQGQQETHKDIRNTQVQPCEALHSSLGRAGWTHPLQEVKWQLTEEAALARSHQLMPQPAQACHIQTELSNGNKVHFKKINILFGFVIA